MIKRKQISIELQRNQHKKYDASKEKALINHETNHNRINFKPHTNLIKSYT